MSFPTAPFTIRAYGFYFTAKISLDSNCRKIFHIPKAKIVNSHFWIFIYFIIQQNRKEMRKETTTCIHLNNKPNLKNNLFFFLFMWVYQYISTSQGVNYYTSSTKTMTLGCNHPRPLTHLLKFQEISEAY